MLHENLPVSNRVNLPVASGVTLCRIVDMRKRTKRKVWGLVNPIQHAIEGAAKTSGEDVDRLMIGELSAIESFRTGQAVDEDWHLLTVMTEISGFMAYDQKQTDVLKAARQAWKALGDMKERHERTGKWGCTGPELQTLRDIIEWHDAQRSVVTRGGYAQAIYRAKELILNKQLREKIFKESA